MGGKQNFVLWIFSPVAWNGVSRKRNVQYSSSVRSVVNCAILVLSNSQKRAELKMPFLKALFLVFMLALGFYFFPLRQCLFDFIVQLRQWGDLRMWGVHIQVSITFLCIKNNTKREETASVALNLCISSGRFGFLKCQMLFSFIHHQNCFVPSQAAEGFLLLCPGIKIQQLEMLQS